LAILDCSFTWLKVMAERKLSALTRRWAKPGNQTRTLNLYPAGDLTFHARAVYTDTELSRATWCGLV
jgi:hypothetical protein